MKIDIFILFFLYFASILSTLGYGIYFQKKINISANNICLGYSLLIGVFFLLIYSYFSNFFYAHNAYHNLILLFLGLSLFFFNYINRIFSKKNIKTFVIVFLLIFISILISKSHDDFPYYHFPYTYYLTQNSSLIGIGNFNHGFRTPSSLFYFNSLFYLPFIKYYLFHIGSAIIYGSAIFIFISNLKEKLKKNNINYLYFFDLLSLVFILVFFYRLAEHGTDRSAQILIFLIISEIFKILILKKITLIEISKLSILFAITISLKALYFLYGLLLIPLLIIASKKIGYKKLMEKIFVNKSLYLSIVLIIFVLITNFFNTGCFIYPLLKSCFVNFDWSIQTKVIESMALHYENWSKAGMTPNFKIDNPSNYVKSFNWINGWFNRYFFFKVSDFLIGVIFLISIFLGTFYTKKKVKKNFNKEILLVYLTIAILLIEWFINHPTLRYGGYSLIAILIFVPCTLILERFKNKIGLTKKKTIVLLIIGFTVFIFRNTDRIINENKKYNYNPFLYPYYKIDNTYFRIENETNNLIKNYYNCEKGKKRDYNHIFCSH